MECGIESRRFETEYAVKSFFSSLTEKPFKPFFNSQQFKSVTERFKPKQHLRPIFPTSSSSPEKPKPKPIYVSDVTGGCQKMIPGLIWPSLNLSRDRISFNKVVVVVVCLLFKENI